MEQACGPQRRHSVGAWQDSCRHTQTQLPNRRLAAIDARLRRLIDCRIGSQLEDGHQTRGTALPALLQTGHCAVPAPRYPGRHHEELAPHSPPLPRLRPAVLCAGVHQAGGLTRGRRVRPLLERAHNARALIQVVVAPGANIKRAGAPKSAPARSGNELCGLSRTRTAR